MAKINALDKNILFYSIQQQDRLSNEIIAELGKNTDLMKQFVLICVDDRTIKIPEKIKQIIDKIPVVIPANFGKIISGNEALLWLRNNSFSKKANEIYDFGTFDDKNVNYAYLLNESEKSEYQQYFNPDYNQGYTSVDSIINSRYTNKNSDIHIDTYDDNSTKNGTQKIMSSKLDLLKQQREKDINVHKNRIGFQEQFADNNISSGGSRNSKQEFSEASNTGNAYHNLLVQQGIMKPRPSMSIPGVQLPFQMRQQQTQMFQVQQAPVQFPQSQTQQASQQFQLPFRMPQQQLYRKN